MHLPPRWMRRLLAIDPAEAADGSPVSTLEMFFAEVRWTEDVNSRGQRTLRRGVM